MPDYLGVSTSDDWWNSIANYAYVWKAVAPVSGTLTDLSIVLNNAPDGNCRLGVYSDSSGPNALLLDAGVVTMGSSGIRTITGLSLAITQGVTYWLSVLMDTAAQVSSLNGTYVGVVGIYSRSYALGFESTWGGGAPGNNSYMWTLYGTITAGATENNVLFMIFES